uniref:Uncharacterized protein n=1 Tax=Arundo donax TaxID=35708 RepID=A0A0A9CLU0_ARUDO
MSTAVRAGIAHGSDHTAAGSTPASAVPADIPAGPVQLRLCGRRRPLGRPNGGLHGAKGGAFGLGHAHLHLVHLPVPVPTHLRIHRHGRALLSRQQHGVPEPRRGHALAAALGRRHALGGGAPPRPGQRRCSA